MCLFLKFLRSVKKGPPSLKQARTELIFHPAISLGLESDVQSMLLIYASDPAGWLPEVFSSDYLASDKLNHVIVFGRSAYRNVPGREASSHQGGGQYWVVDYIFYSTKFSSRFNKNVEGRLKLVSRLRLPSERECRTMGGLPNPSCPSDHICLLAKFALT